LPFAGIEGAHHIFHVSRIRVKWHIDVEALLRSSDKNLLLSVRV
jgi:hypothetical protein